MGTDYNTYNQSSPIHIHEFKDILTFMNVNEYNQIDEDLLLLKIYTTMRSNMENTCCKETAIALNMYLNDLETDLHFINPNIDVNINKFLKYSKRNVYCEYSTGCS